MVDDRHLHGFKPARNRLADRAHADQADCAVAQRRLGERIILLPPFAGPQVALRLRKFANGAKQKAERRVGDFLDEHIRRVGEDDTVRGRPFDVHMVVADPETRYDLQLGKPRHEVAGDSFGRGAAGDRADIAMGGRKCVGVLGCRHLVNRAGGFKAVHDHRLERPEQQDLFFVGLHRQSLLIRAYSPVFR